jgi:hypothetical protein
VKLRLGKRAQQQIRKIEQWWVEHRAAPELFTDELEQTFRHICSVRIAGIRWPTVRRPTLRRILMARTGNHVYFVVDDATRTVFVLAVWGAPRGAGPRL